MMIGRLCGGTSCAQGRSGGYWGHCYDKKGQTPGWRKFLQGDGPIDTNVWLGDVGIFGGNGEEGSRDTHIVPPIYHGETSTADMIQYVVDARDGIIVGSSRKEFGNDMYR